jgi:hypothetical protein
MRGMMAAASGVAYWIRNAVPSVLLPAGLPAASASVACGGAASGIAANRGFDDKLVPAILNFPVRQVENGGAVVTVDEASNADDSRHGRKLAVRSIERNAA